MLTSYERLKALIFDVDGTLYEQGPVRRTMVYRILRAHLTSPARGLLTLWTLRAYRQAQEVLRGLPPGSGDLAGAQLELASRRTGVSVQRIAFLVAHWMEQEPLPLLASSMRKGTLELLGEAKKRGLRLAAWSDYPAERKLAAMGIGGFFDVVVAAQDPEVQRFKPDPRGLETALQRLALQKNEVLYVGDRPDVDGAAASRAGIRHIIMSRGQNFTRLLGVVAKS